MREPEAMSDLFGLWLEFEHWQPETGDDPEDDCFNMLIELPDGSKYALNVWTFKFLSRAIDECRTSGEHLGGAYLPPPDLFVERLERAHLEAVIADLIHCEGLKQEWLVSEEEQ
jgi:hypothetical protein